MYSALFSILIGILLVCPETDSLTWTGQPANPTKEIEGNNVVLTWNYALTTDEQSNSQNFFLIQWFKFNLSSLVFDQIASKTFLSRANPPLSYAEPLSPLIVIDRNHKTDSVTLRINDVKIDDEGQYKIRYVQDVLGTVLAELAMNLTVDDPPSNIVTSSVQTVSLYDELSLNCSADGRPKPTITWTRLSDNTIVSMPFDISSRQYGGYYRCTADNGVGHSLTKDVFINVLFPPVITIESKLFVGREQTASLNCEVEGNPTPWIHWTPCDLPSIGCDKQYLNISKVQTSRVNYTCTASNYVGNRSETTLLIIGGTNIFISLSTSGECDEKDSVWGSLQNELAKVFANSQSYIGAELIADIRCGSLIFDVVLKFNSQAAEDVIISTIKNAIVDGMLGELKVNASSIVGIPPVPVPTTTPPLKTAPKPESTHDEKKS